MLKMFNKAVGFPNCLFMIPILVLWCNKPVQAQDQGKFTAYLKAVKNVLNNADLKYSYRMTMKDENSKGPADAVDGILIKQGNNYLDSNRQFITLSANGYFMKLQLQQKVASVYRISSIEKKTGVKMQDSNTGALSIADSMLQKAGRFAMVSETDVVDFVYTMVGGYGAVNSIEFKLRKIDLALTGIIITSRQKGSYTKTMHLYGFTNNLNANAISPFSYFRVSGTKVTMLNKLQSFKVNAFL